MKRRDLISAVMALPAMAGIKAMPLVPGEAVDAEVPQAGATKVAEPPFVIVLQPDRPLREEVVERIREQMTEFLIASGVNAKAVVLPNGMTIKTVTTDGVVHGGEPEAPQSDDYERPWIGDVLFHFYAVADQIQVSIEGWDLHPRSVRHAAVTLKSRTKYTSDWNGTKVSPDFSSTHRIAIDERTNSLSRWGSVEAINEHNAAREKRDSDTIAAKIKEVLAK
jgi:hypothetical protein